ncbi:hypothetical protein BRAS3843_430018 [Bradyrhizobium sp. STM 3843]|nr:hypothetical protein BRAS3843_430018 [Bradyrhizobium sp. STM 3843]
MNAIPFLADAFDWREFANDRLVPPIYYRACRVFVRRPFQAVHMLKSVAAALFAFSFLSQADQFLSQGRYTEGLILIARHVVRSFVG